MKLLKVDKGWWRGDICDYLGVCYLFDWTDISMKYVDGIEQVELILFWLGYDDDFHTSN